VYLPDNIPLFDFEILKRNIAILPGDATPLIDAETTSYVVNLCKRFEVGVDRCGIASAPYKVGRTIFIDTSVAPERQNWAFSHELAHLLLNHGDTSIPSPEEEFLANQLAAELLLPAEDFIELVRYANLAELKAEFPQASWEAILRRRLQFRQGIGTIFDEGKMTFRSASPDLTFPPQPLPEEWTVAKDSFNTAQSLSRTTNEFAITADYVDTGSGIRRVLLWTESVDTE
jgi:hypothetical protein